MTTTDIQKIYNPITQRWVPVYDGTDALGDYNKIIDRKVLTVDTDGNVITTDKEFNQHSSGAKREKLKGVRYDYMPSKIVNEAYGRVAEFGAKKYDVDNWKKGLPMSQISESLQRHLWAFFDGEDYDEESKLCHIDHILWNAVALAYNRYHNIEDDRFESRKNSN